jgi:colicin import membrane protein
MQITADNLDLKPPRPGRWSMPLVLALVAHGLLVGALTWGVHWQRDAEPVSFEAELWSAVAQRAAPRAVEPPPPPPVREPKVKPEPKPEPQPEPKVEPPKPDTRAADIATAEAKKKKLEDEKRAAAEKAAKEKAEKAAKEKAAKERDAKEKAEKAAREKAERAEQAKKQAQEKADRERKAAEAIEKLRQENLRRMMGQAGATGDANATGTAQRSSGPSAGYAGRVNAAIRPNVLLTEDIPGNPMAEVEVRSAPDGTVISRRLVRSSGSAAWDRAALAAIDRTGKLPRDTDGRVPTPMILEMRPRN